MERIEIGTDAAVETNWGEVDKNAPKFCNCSDKQILVQGDGSHIAQEEFCPRHGYVNSCYLCYWRCNTELCRRHAFPMRGDI